MKRLATVVVHATLPGATIPFKFTGNWAPDPSTYGVLISGPIVVTEAEWSGDPSQPVYPQFRTNKGQQIGAIFFFWGTFIGLTSSPTTPGIYLWPTAADYSAAAALGVQIAVPSPAPTPEGSVSTMGWQQINGQPYNVRPIPVPPAPPVITLLSLSQQLNTVQSDLDEIKSRLNIS